MPKLICIAPGHGGFDPGACANGFEEKNFTLGIGLALRGYLQAAGVPVVMTRTGDYAAGHATTVMGDLENECAIANNAKADLFMCIHINASTDTAATGAQSFVYRSGGPSEQLATQLTDALGSALGVRQPPAVVDPGLYVLAHTNMSAVLTECGFITNAAQAVWLNAHMDEVAKLLSGPLIAWAGGTVFTPPADIAGQPYAQAAEWAMQAGLMTATNGQFLPDNPILRWELAVVLERFNAYLAKKG